MLRAIYTFWILDHVPLNQAISYGLLSWRVGLDEDKLRGILSFTYTMHMFCEAAEDQVAHIVTSRFLAKIQDTMNFLGHAMEDVFPGGARQSEAPPK